MLYYAMLCYDVMRCDVMWCDAMWCVVLCCVVLYCQWYVSQPYFYYQAYVPVSLDFLQSSGYEWIKDRMKCSHQSTCNMLVLSIQESTWMNSSPMTCVFVYQSVAIVYPLLFLALSLSITHMFPLAQPAGLVIMSIQGSTNNDWLAQDTTNQSHGPWLNVPRPDEACLGKKGMPQCYHRLLSHPNLFIEIEREREIPQGLIQNDATLSAWHAQSRRLWQL